MARTFVAITGGGAGGAFVNDDPFGYKRVEKIRQALDQGAYGAYVYELGGDETPMIITTPATFERVRGARTHELDGDNFGGLTLEAVLFYYTTAAATSVQLRVRNLTDSSNAAVGTVSVSTTLVMETVALTMASGNKQYQLQFDAGNTTNGVCGWGFIQNRAIPV